MKYVLDTCARDIPLKGEVYIVPEVAAEIKEEHSYIVRSPSIISLQISVYFLLDYIADFEKRLVKGLKLTENELREASEEALLDGYIDVEARIHDLRKRWRGKLRSGIVDSQADFNTVLLAKDLDAILVTKDEGLKLLAMRIGVKLYDQNEHLTNL